MDITGAPRAVGPRPGCRSWFRLGAGVTCDAGRPRLAGTSFPGTRDLGLPAGDGFVVLERLQKNPQLAVIPVIVLSARSARDSEQRALEAGALTYFEKPIETEELLEVIERAIQV